ncbi:hypothetical protein [Winogradskyella sp.]|jgi:hypothetical protein|uniref:hypothetical protein n=1 Tax=Winogradskyella sp. TaxID=1883156 RepID=UPI0025D8238F|nr:hypothetical protein [Winogradskyella sp.]MCT4628305.1 hypothetical protein [Winogradskyella sp.]
MKLKKITHIIIACLFLSVINCSKDDSQPSNPFQGVVEKITTYGGSKNESAKAVTKTNDGGYAVLGHTQSIDGDITDKQNENFDYWLLKFDSENNLQWSKTYGGSNDDRGNDIIQTADGGYIVIGYSSSNDEDVSENAGLRDYWLLKLDASGNIIWQKSYGYSGIDVGHNITQTNDGGFFITGVLDVTASGGEGNTSRNANRHAGGDYWALKLDTSGNIEWSKYFGGGFTDTPYDAIQTNDGYIIVGSSDSDDVDISDNKGTYDFWVVKISNTGSMIWEKSFGGDEIDEARAIASTNDGNFIIAGDTRSNNTDVSQNNGAADLWLIKISPIGDLIWEKTYGGSSFDVARSIERTEDNGFLISGSSRSSDGDLSVNQGQNDAWVIKTDANGQIQWQKTIGGTDIDFAFDATELNDNTLVVVGESNSNDLEIENNKGFTDLLIVKID